MLAHQRYSGPGLSCKWAIEWTKRWSRNKDPELRLWEVMLIGLACIALVAWGLHSIP